MKTKFNMNNRNGFTLVELMIVVLLTGIAVIAIYRGYTAFSHSADVQEQIIEMQQNLRIGMQWLEKDLRRADMTEEDNNVVEISGMGKKFAKEVIVLTADDSSVEFGMDLTGAEVGETNGLDDNGNTVIDEPGETDGEDNDGDGDIDEEDEIRVGDGDFDDDGERIIYSLNGTNLQRQVWDGEDGSYDPPLTIITNVNALNFVYLDKDGEDLGYSADGIITTTSPGDVDDIISQIRYVQIALVVQTTNEDYRYTDRDPYVNPQGTTILPSQNDNFRRRLLVKRIKVRNAGLL